MHNPCELCHVRLTAYRLDDITTWVVKTADAALHGRVFWMLNACPGHEKEIALLCVVANINKVSRSNLERKPKYTIAPLVSHPFMFLLPLADCNAATICCFFRSSFFFLVWFTYSTPSLSSSCFCFFSAVLAAFACSSYFSRIVRCLVKMLTMPLACSLVTERTISVVLSNLSTRS